MSASSFPSCTWERPLFLAKFYFALTQAEVIVLRSAMKLPQQYCRPQDRSQAPAEGGKLGNEGIDLRLL